MHKSADEVGWNGATTHFLDKMSIFVESGLMEGKLLKAPVKVTHSIISVVIGVCIRQEGVFCGGSVTHKVE